MRVRRELIHAVSLMSNPLSAPRPLPSLHYCYTLLLSSFVKKLNLSDVLRPTLESGSVGLHQRAALCLVPFFKHFCRAGLCAPLNVCVLTCARACAAYCG